MSRKKSPLLFWSLTSALAGFLFGFDTVVISGAEKQIQDLWSLSGSIHGWAMSAALWGTLIGALSGGIPTARFGRKKVLVSIGLLYLVSALGSAFAGDVYSFVIFRFIGGLGVGASTIAAPLFISEIAPPENRGKLAGLFQFNIVFGILIAYFSNYLMGTFASEAHAWRWMLGVEALPALIYSAMAFALPESPRWLITHAGKPEQGAKVFSRINPGMQDSDIEKLVSEVQSTINNSGSKPRFWTKRLSIPILLAVLIAFFNQLSGINVILYFAPRLLDLAGLQNALAASVSLGVTNIVFTFAGLWLIDRLGRRSLLYIGSVGYIVSLGVCALMFLSFTEFKVLSAAIDLAGSSEKVMRIENKEGHITEADRQKAYEELTLHKASLKEALSFEKYEGDPVIIPDGTSASELKAIAEQVKATCSGLLGINSFIVLICVIVFLASHAIGQGAVIWVFISEIFPNDHRAAGQSLGSSTHWVFAALLTLLFPIVIKKVDAGFIFAFFCLMMMLQLLWVRIMVPETKGKSLEEIDKELGK